MTESIYAAGAKAIYTACPAATDFTYDAYLAINAVNSNPPLEAAAGDAGLLFRVTNATVGLNSYWGMSAGHLNVDLSLPRRV